ncbi:MAG: ATPase, T2SS/T4P/T4SS family [Planctomycetota bacterium]
MARPTANVPNGGLHNGRLEGDGKEEPLGDVELERQRMIDRIAGLPKSVDVFAVSFLDELFDFAKRIGTSDIHLQPVRDGLQVSFRDDGMLKTLDIFDGKASTAVVSRLKVLADLLTYKADVPQEGRVKHSHGGNKSVAGAEVRVSTFPTMYGERAVLRFFGHHGEYKHLEDLGHNDSILQSLREAIEETSGALLVCGPAGSGKSTTLYSCLRHLQKHYRGTRAVLTVEDPIEVPIEGIAQSQVNAPAGFDLHTALRSLLRQDPEVFVVGEVRDPITAQIAFQACLAGQLMLATFHADSVATAITRMIDMGIEPYQMRSGLIGILCQRLVRKPCECAYWTEDHSAKCGLPVSGTMVAQECEKCQSTGYRGRRIIGEYLSLRESDAASELVTSKDSRVIYRRACELGMKSIWQHATELVQNGETTAAEVRRVLGRTMRI